MPFDIRGWLESRLPGGRITGSGWYRVKCPFHSDRSPSFAVNIRSGNFGCKAVSCGASGGLVRLIREIEHISWNEAFAIIDKPNPFDVGDDIPSIGSTKTQSPVRNDFPPALIQVSAERFPVYLRDRGYDPSNVHRFGLWFGNSGQMKNYLVFPFWNMDGNYRTYVARIMDKKSKGRYLGPEMGLAPSSLYGVWLFSSLQSIPDGIFVVEGQFDVMRMWSFGLPAVGLSTAASTPAQRNQLAMLHHIFHTPIYIMFDAGEHELESARETAGALSCQNVPAAVINIPDGVKDPDQMNASHAAQVLDKCKELRYSMELP